MQKIIQHVKDYWPLWGIAVAVATALTTYIGLPKRLAHVEAGQATLEDTFQDYLQAQKEAMAEQRGYQKALNENVLQQQLQQAPNTPQRRDAPTAPRETTWVEYDQDGTCWSCSALTKEECWTEDAQTGRNRWRVCEP